MQNIILQGMLKDFSDRHGLTDISEDRQFEMFCNYCILSNDHYDSFAFDKVATGDAQGVDGLAVVIGDIIVNEVEDAVYYTNGQFNATLHFSQSKTSGNFDLGDFLKFSSIVRNFFSGEKSTLPAELGNAFDIKEVLYSKAGKMTNLPVLKLWYCYVGEYQIDAGPVKAIVEKEIAALRNEKYKFSSVDLDICDGSSLAQMYREAQNNTIGKASFQRHVALPNIGRATAAYIGVMKCRDYIQLIRKKSGEINKGLFYENVRDFLGKSNPINKEIGQTISSAASKDQFAILNNGVTIVAKKVVPSGDVFEIHRFQIVNGCQTSHVLFNNSNQVSDQMYVTVKLIETDDVDLTNSIVKSANSQSLVMKEAFATIRPYHRVLEDFFNAMRGGGFNFFYERRPHQYDEDVSIKNAQVVSVPNVMKSFVSVVMEEPHKVHYYYGRLLEEYNSSESSELFSEEDYPGLYFASQLIASKVRDRVGRDKSLKDWAYHVALLIKRATVPQLRRGVSFTDKKFRALIADIENDFDSAFVRACDLIRRKKLARNDNRIPDVTAMLLREFGLRGADLVKASPQPIAGSFVTAIVSGSASNDGDFIGRFESFDVDRKIMIVSYGSRLLEVPAPFLVGGEIPLVGAHVRFKRLGGKIVSASMR